MHIIGIDPGITGGVVWINELSGLVSAWKTPRLGKEMDKQECSKIIRQIMFESRDSPIRCIIEKVWSFPGQAGINNFTIGYGVWLGILAALGIGITEVTPATWHKQPNLPRRDAVKKIEGEDHKLFKARKAMAKLAHKKALMSAAKDRHPEIPDMTDGISDAVWIAHYGLGR